MEWKLNMDAVIDSSVLFDLEICSLLDAFAKLPIKAHVTYILYEDELKPDSSISPTQHELEINELSPVQKSTLYQLQHSFPAFSKPDLSIFVLAFDNDWMLLTGDRKLRKLAECRGVICHGVLWILDQLLILGISTPMTLHQSLTTLKYDRSSRLPLKELNLMLKRFAQFFLHNSLRN